MNVRTSVHRDETLFARDSVEERVAFEPSRLRDVDVKGLAVRFVFGFVISVAVGAIGLSAGDRVAGLFLAFPAILPASLTLIAAEDGEEEATVDAVGACFGCVGLAAYGATSWFLLPRVAPVLAELGALAAWAVVAIGAYFSVRSRMARSLNEPTRS
jgi:uncharacterized membrane protein (GlpM family)